MGNRKEVFARPKRWSADTLWGTGYKFQKLYCDCEKCLSASTAKRHNKKKNK